MEIGLDIIPTFSLLKGLPQIWCSTSVWVVLCLVLGGLVGGNNTCLAQSQINVCNNVSNESPDNIEYCASSVPQNWIWSDWYDPNNEVNWPYIVDGQWTSPSGVSTDLAVGDGLPLSSTESGLWELTFNFTDTVTQNGISISYSCSTEILITFLPASADFIVLQEGLCADETYIFELTPDLNIDYDWDFGDGTSSNLPQPGHVFQNVWGGGSETIAVELTITTEDGCTDSHTEFVTVLQTPNPGLQELGALCTTDATWPTFQLDLQPIPFPSFGIASWQLDWGNGTDTSFTDFSIVTSNFQSDFPDFGFYTITLDVVGDNGCTNSSISELFVGNNPQIGTANPGNTDGLCSPYELTFPITNYEANSEGTVYEVDFGDGVFETYEHNPPISPPPEISHFYSLSSCGEITPEGSENAFRFRISAENACGTSVTTVDPIRIHLSPNPELSGPEEVCMEQAFNYLVTGQGLMVTESTCDTSDVYWQVTPLDGQQNVSPDQFSGTQAEVTFPEPGLYEISILDIHPTCPNAEESMTVCVFPELQAIETHAPESGCAPLTIDLQNLSPMPEFCGIPQNTWTVSGGAYEWAAGSTPFQDTPSLVLLSAGLYTITLKIEIEDNDACDPAETSFEIEVFDDPLVDISALGQVCAGEGLEIPITSYSDGGTPITQTTWTQDATIISTALAPVTVSFPLPGVHSVVLEIENMCGIQSDTVIITVDSLPEIEFELPDLPAYCAGDTLLVIGSGAFSYQWDFSPEIIGASDGHCASIAPSDDVTLTLGGTGANGCQADSSIFIEIAPNPTAEIVLPSTPCPGENVTITGSGVGGAGGFSYGWTTSDGGTSSTASIDWATPSISSTLGIGFTVIDSLGCSSTSQIDFTTFDNPTTVAGPGFSICDNATFTTALTGYSPALNEGGGTGIWTGDGLVGQDSFQPPGVGLFNLTYTFTDANGCTADDLTTISVTTFEEVNAGNPLSACNLDAEFTITDFTPNSASWSGTGVSANGAVSPQTLTPGDYILTIENGFESCFSTADIALTIHPMPSPVVSGPSPLCIGNPFSVGAVEDGGAELAWVFDGSFVLSFDTTAVALDMSFEVEATSEFGCISSASWSPVINALPVTDAGNDAVFCNQTSNETLSGFSPVGGDWTGAGIIDSDGVFDPGAVGVGTFSLVYTVTNIEGCTASDSTEAVVQDPILANAGSDIEICDIDTTLTFAGFYPAALGTWSGPGVLDAASGLITAAALAPGSYTYTYAYGAASCATSDNLELLVRERPTVSITPSDMAPCIGDAISFNASASGGDEPYVYNWSNNVMAGGNAATAIAAPSGDFTVFLEVVDANGCSGSSAITISIQALPAVVAGNDTAFCNTGILGQLEGFSPGLEEGGIGTWSMVEEAAGVLSPDGLFSPSLSGAGAFEVLYTFVEASTGCYNSDTLNVIVSDPTVAAAGVDTTVCDNAPLLQLEGFYPTTGVLWSSSNPAAQAAIVSASLGLINPALLPPGDYNYLLEFGYGTCYTQDEITLHVNPLPAVDIGPDDVFCVNDGQVNLTWATPDGGFWEGPGVVNAQGTFDADASGSGAGQFVPYYWYESALTGCRDTVEHLVTVHEIPVVDAGLDTTFCNTGIPGQLEGFSPGISEGGTGTWAMLDPGIDAVTADGEFAPDISGLGDFLVVYSFTSDITNCTNTDTLNVNVSDPVIADAGADTTVCNNAPLLQLQGFYPATAVLWSSSNPTAQAAIVSASQGVVDPALLPPGDYVYLLENGNGTCYTWDELTLTIKALPAITPGLPDAFCANIGMSQLAAMAPAGGYWFGTQIVDPAVGIFDPLTAPGNYLSYYVFQDQITGCRDTASHMTQVDPVPVAAFLSDSVGCDNAPLPISNESTGSSSYLWDLEGSISGDFEPNYIFPEAGNFEIVLESFNAFGCVDTAQTDVIIAEMPVAAFTLLADSGCSTFTLQPENISQGLYVSFDWEINGVSYGEAAPIGVQLQAIDSIVDVPISLEASNLCGTHVAAETVQIYPLPLMEFALAEDTVCSPFGMEYSNVSVGLPDLTTWDFGNGQFFTGETPGTQYYEVDTLELTFEVVLIGVNECGSDTAVLELLVLPNVVTAFFTTSTPEGCVPLSITVDDFSIGATSVNYDFGNLDFSADPTATTLYDEPGTYTVTQYISNGCSYDTSSTTVLVNPVLDVSVAADQDTLCEMLPFEFEAIVENPGAASWSFGDGTSGQGLSPMHGYTEAGAYWVVFTTEAQLTGCQSSDSALVLVLANPEISIEPSTAYGCSPLAVNFENTTTGAGSQLWNFGDGSQTDVIAEPAHLFLNQTLSPVQYAVSMTATSVELCSSSVGFTITVLPTPIAEFSLAESESCVNPADLQINNSTYGGVNYAWDISGLDNDQATLFGANPGGWQIDGVGEYSVDLLVANGYGCSDSTTHPFTIHQTPVANILAAPYSGCNPLTVHFSDISQFNLSTSLFIEGIYDGPLPEYGLVIDQVGDFSGEIVAISDEGCLDTLQIEEHFIVHPIPYAGFSTTPLVENSTVNLTYNFENTSSGFSYASWNFGDGTGSYVASPSHTYQQSGAFLVSLEVQSEFGCLNNAYHTIDFGTDLLVFVPNAFTPDNDGDNDGFRVEFSDLDRVEAFHFMIFNRWGEVLFETRDPLEYWMGNCQNCAIDFGVSEAYVKDEVYNWVMVYGAKPKRLTGTVTIVR
jgi:PKD repeat protein